MKAWVLSGVLILAATVACPAAAEPELWQTNSRGDDIHVFDVRTRRLLRRIVVGPEPHGLAAPRDARVVYATLEANDRPRGELLWIDPRSYRVRHRMELCREPHAIATTPDGRFVYVPCRDEHYWVVDAEARKVVARIHTAGRPHNTQISRDGRWAFLSPMGASAAVTVVDVAAGHEVAGEIRFSDSVRPPALSADGKSLFQHVDGLNGFEVADVVRRRVVATVEHRVPLGWFLLHPRAGWIGWEGLQRCHGLAIRPDQTEIWSVCGAAVTVHDLTRPGFGELAHVPLEQKGYWITFSPGSRWAFVAQSDAGRVAVLDAETKRVVAHLDAGHGPKRNLVIEPSSRAARSGVEPCRPSSPNAATISTPCASSPAVWLRHPLDAHRCGLRDVENPHSDQRSRPVVGLQIVRGLRLGLRAGSAHRGGLSTPAAADSRSAVLVGPGADAAREPRASPGRASALGQVPDRRGPRPLLNRTRHTRVRAGVGSPVRR